MAALPGLNEADRSIIPASLHPRVKGLTPKSFLEPSTAMGSMVLVLDLTADARARVNQLLADQLDPASPRYHQWLTPDQFGEQFGPSRADLDHVTTWLAGHGLSVASVSRSGLAITFTGTSSQVEEAFATRMARYDDHGVTHVANATEISIPRALSGLVGGVLSLHDYRRRSACRCLGPLTDFQGVHYLSPGDWARIYNLIPLYQRGITGAGVNIGIVGRTDVEAGDSTWFLSNFGQPGSTAGEPDVIHNGATPGLLGPEEEFEADLDTQWSAGLAPGAAIQFVVSPSSLVTDGVDLSSQHLVDTNLAPIISSSFGAGEDQLGSAENTFYNQMWMQASTQGISVFVAAGDSGAAGDDDPTAFTATEGQHVSGLASTPYDTCVGGTLFLDGSGTYWGSTGVAGSFPPTALGYIPEGAWNEAGTDMDGAGLWAGGGGASTLYAKPTWQVAPGVPADNRRDVPDIAFTAASHDAYLVVQGASTVPPGYLPLMAAGGTSAASPSMAAVMSLVVQEYGRQGNAAPTLYQLAGSRYSTVFHDITSGTNTVPGVTGFNAGVGYDQATGLGSLDGTALVDNWPGTTVSPIIVTVGDSQVDQGPDFMFTANATGGVPGATYTYSWAFGDGTTGTGSSVTHSYAPTAVTTYVASVTASDGTTTSQPQFVGVQAIPPGVLLAVITTPALDADVLPGISISFVAGTLGTWPSGTTIISYAWDFGDGTTSTGSQTSHAFTLNNSAPYVVTLTLTDNNGHQSSASRKVYATYDSMFLSGHQDVDVRDLAVLASYWGTPGTVNGVSRALEVFGDLNHDGQVDDSDIDLWIHIFSTVGQ
jgi:subtilase family serine protease